MSKKSRGSIDQVVANLVKWIHSDPAWSETLADLLVEHTAMVADTLQATTDEIAHLLGPAAPNLVGTAFEDMISSRFHVEPDNPVDAYLRRRGWRETPPGRRYLEVLRDSVMSFYEVLAVEPGSWVEVRDRLRGGEPIRVTERSASHQLVRWDQVATRLIPTAAGPVFSGVLLPLESAFASKAADLFKTTAERLTAEPDRESTTVADQQNRVLRELAPTIANLWILQTLSRLHRPLPEMVNFDGEPIQFCEVHFPLNTGATATAIAARMEGLNGWKVNAVATENGCGRCQTRQPPRRKESHPRERPRESTLTRPSRRWPRPTAPCAWNRTSSSCSLIPSNGPSAAQLCWRMPSLG